MAETTPNVESETSPLRHTVNRFRAAGRRDLVRFKIFVEPGTGKVVKQPLDKWQSGHVDDLVIDEHVRRGQPVACRLPPGVVVLDFDPRNGGHQAFVRLKAIDPDVQAWFAATERTDTGGGGVHYYGLVPASTRLTGQIHGYPGVDVKGPGSLVLIAGSPYADDRSYRAVREGPCLPVPPALLALISRQDAGTNAEHDGTMAFDEVEDLLQEIGNPDVDYDAWFAVLAAVHHELGEEGRELALRWSTSSDKHEQGRFDTAWDSLGRYGGPARRTGASLVHLARYGWPASAVEDFGEGESREDSAVLPSGAVDEFVFQDGDADVADSGGDGNWENRESPDGMPSSTDLVVPLTSATTDPVRWLIKGWLPLESLLLLIGAPGSFKSFLSIMWSIHVASGRDWAGARVREARTVVYLAGEGQHGLLMRFQAAARRLGVDLDALPIVILGPGQHVDLMMPKAGARLVEAVDALVEAKGMPKVGLVVVDTFARLAAGDENSAEDVAIYFKSVGRFMRSWGAAVLTVHHPGHSNGDRARGSSAWRAAMDGEYLIKRVSGSLAAVLTPAKVKDGRTPADVGLRAEEAFFGVDEDGDEITTLALDVDHQVIEDVESDEDARDMDLMRAIVAADGRLSYAEVASAIGWERSAVINRVRGLRRRGWVRQEGKLRATPAGIDAVADA